MLTQSLNHVRLLSFAHTITQSYLSNIPCSHSHSIASFYCPLHTKSLNYILLSSHTRTTCPFDPKYPTHTITQSYLSNIPCSHNHSIKSFNCPLHTEALHHILLSLGGHVLFDPTYPTQTISQSYCIPCSHRLSIISFYCPLHTQSITHVLNSIHALTVTSRPLHAQSQVTYQSHSSIIQCSHNHSITSFQPPH